MTDLEITQRLLSIAFAMDNLARKLAEHDDETRRQHSRELICGASMLRTLSLYVPQKQESRT